MQYRVAKEHSVLALDKVSLDIPASGYTMGIVGESGSGKTTLGSKYPEFDRATGEDHGREGTLLRE